MLAQDLTATAISPTNLRKSRTLTPAPPVSHLGFYLSRMRYDELLPLGHGSLMQQRSLSCKTARKHALRHGMATTNSAPHRHRHPSLTRTHRPKKLPAPSPSATRTFRNPLSSRAATPSLFSLFPRISSLMLPCCTPSVCHYYSHPPLLLPFLRRVRRDDRLRDVP